MSEPQPQSHGTQSEWQESLKVQGHHLADSIQKLIEEGNVRHLVVKHEAHIVLEIPVTWGVAAAVLAPTLAAVAAAGAVLTHCTIEITRTGPPLS